MCVCVCMCMIWVCVLDMPIWGVYVDVCALGYVYYCVYICVF